MSEYYAEEPIQRTRAPRRQKLSLQRALNLGIETVAVVSQLQKVEALVQCWECGHHETRYSGMLTFAYLECSRCRGKLEVLTVNNDPV